jgi:RNA-directed DNA polymerase
MTGWVLPITGAFSAKSSSWNHIDWESVKLNVHRLQMRIAKAIRENRHGKVKSLQWLLTHSYHAKLSAVKRVTQNRGSKTPGVDSVIWRSSAEKISAAKSLQRKGYKAQPLRRIYIPKKNGKQRPLGIPTMKDRAMQALYLLALEPIAETTADKNAYGFRQKRSTADAIEQCFKSLARRNSAQWVLEGDIKACFDTISHQWLLDNVPTDKIVLNKWLAAGYMENQLFYETTEGTPQGGIISPTLMTMTLSGLEKLVNKISKPRDKINVISYADDFIITGATKEILEHRIKPTVSAFLQERGLVLSKEKTQITHIGNGFDFLGFNIRKYSNGKLLIKPTKKNIKIFLDGIRDIMKSNPTIKTESIIRLLNPKIRGWANYYRHVVAKDTFNKIDFHIFNALRKWIMRRHPNKNAAWMRNKYFRVLGNRNWIFFAKIKGRSNEKSLLHLFSANKVNIRRHIKMQADATPFDPAYKTYFEKRERRSKEILKAEKKWLSSYTNIALLNNDKCRIAGLVN